MNCNLIYNCTKNNKTVTNNLLPKEMKDLYTENYKTLIKKLGKTQINVKSCIHELEKVIVNKFINPKQTIDLVQF